MKQTTGNDFSGVGPAALGGGPARPVARLPGRCVMSSWPRLALILGGARSGKSRRAEQLAVASGLPVVFVATCLTRNLDAAMQERLRQHPLTR